MSTICRQIFKTRNISQTRGLFHWINLQFNAVDEDRRKVLGPDRTCAEWILRNGGTVKFTRTESKTSNYNDLPNEQTKVALEEIYAINCSIMKSGFRHFDGCKHIRKIVMHQCNYLESDALQDLKYLECCLQSLEVSNCFNINDQGLLYIQVLRNLREVAFANLPAVKDKDKVLHILQSDMPETTFFFK